MSARMRLKICAYSLSLLGLWAVTVTEHFSSIWSALATVLVAVSWFYEGPREPGVIYRRVWSALAILMVIYFPLDALYSNLLLAAVHVSMFLQAYFLFNRKNMRSYGRIFAVSFAQLLASSTLTTDLVFAVILALYCVVAVYGMILIQLMSHLERSGSGESVLDGDIAAEAAAPRLLAPSLVVTAMLLPLTLAFFYSAPRLTYALVASNRNIEARKQLKQAKTRTGFTTSVQLGSFGRIQEDQTLALRVEFPDDVEPPASVRRWRGGALNIYDGTTWSSSRDYFTYFTGTRLKTGFSNSGNIYPRQGDLFILDRRYGEYRTPAELDNDERLLKYTIYLEIPFSDNVFGVGRISAARGSFSKFGLKQDFNRSFSIHNRPGLAEFISYTAYSDIYEPSPAVLRRISHDAYASFYRKGETGQYFKAHFLQAPPSLDPRIKELALEVTKNRDTPYDKVVAIQDFLENEYMYSLNPGAPISDDPLSDFMFETRKGHCEYFATAMTLMTRAVGIPARLAKGFQRGEWNEDGRFFEVRQRDAHAWVEVYFLEHGWVEFDPSPREAANEYFASLRSPLARAIANKLLALQIMWRRNIVGYNATNRSKLFTDLKNFALRDGPRRAAEALSATWNFAVSHMFGVALVAALALAVLETWRRGALVLPSLAWPARGRKRAEERVAFYGRMLSLLERKKIVKPAHMTALEFLEQPLVRAHPMFLEIEMVTTIYNRARFGKRPAINTETTRINDILKRLKKPSEETRTQEAKA